MEPAGTLVRTAPLRPCALRLENSGVTLAAEPHVDAKLLLQAAAVQPLLVPCERVRTGACAFGSADETECTQVLGAPTVRHRGPPVWAGTRTMKSS